MKITYVYARTQEDGAGNIWRCFFPAQAIQNTQIHSASLLPLDEFNANTELAQKVCSASDLIVIHRHLYGQTLTTVERWKARDKTIIFDYDMAFHCMSKDMNLFETLTPDETLGRDNPSFSILDQLRWGMKMVDAVTVSSPRLAADLSDYGKVHYIPDFIKLDHYTNIVSEPHHGITLGWGGGDTHSRGFMQSGILPALEQICAERKNVRVVFYGGNEELFNHLDIHPDQKEVCAWVDHSRWPSALSQIDIGLAPFSGAFDVRRSWRLLLEYAVMQVPWAASNALDYPILTEMGRFVENHPVAWKTALDEMINHLAEQKNIAKSEPYLFGLCQDIDLNIHKILALYANISENSLIGASNEST